MTDYTYTPHKLPDGRAMLNIGCGDRFHPSWTNIDLNAPSPHVIAHDISSGLPFNAALFDVVYHSHVLEHLQPDDGRALVDECYRVLKPGGITRVVLPDLEFSVRLYLQCLDEVAADESDITQEHYEWALLNLIDQMVRTRSGGRIKRYLQRETLHDLGFIIDNGGGRTIRDIRETHLNKQANLSQQQPRLPFRKKVAAWIRYRVLGRKKRSPLEQYAQFRTAGELHQWMYDRYSLRRLLADCGFQDIVQLSERESRIADWDSFHLDVDANGAVYKPNSLVFEGCK